MQKGIYYWNSIKIVLLVVFVGVLSFVFLYKMLSVFTQFAGFMWVEEMPLNLVKNASIAGLAGLVTNMGAIWLLFRPHTPIGWKHFRFGLIPANKKRLVENISRGITEEFLDVDTLAHHIDKKVTLNELFPEKNTVTQSLTHVFTRITPKGLKKSIICKAISKIDFQTIITDKMYAMDIVTFERLVKKTAGETLIAIEVLGGVLGAFMGAFFTILL